MSPETPMYSQLIMSIIDNMNVSNREELIAAMEQANQPNPEAQKAQQQAQQSELQFKAAQSAALNGQATESQARAQKLTNEAQAVPQETEIARIRAITTNLKQGDADDKEFSKRLEISKQLLKEREVAVKEVGQAPQAPQEPQLPPQPVTPMG
jgi:hypothetical protein